MAYDQRLIHIAPPPDGTFMLNYDTDLDGNPRQQAKFNHTIKDFQHICYMALQAYQTHHELSFRHDYNVYFPGAFSLREGQTVLNLTTGKGGKVLSHRPHGNGYLAKLDFTPANSDRLWFSDEKHFIDFRHADSRAEANSIEYQNKKEVVKEASPFVPTIVWAVFKEEPASAGKPFGDQDVRFKPKRAMEYAHPNIQGYRVLEDYQEFDNLILFDLYASNESEATRLKDWFKLAMRSYAWWFTYMGYVQFYFWRSNWELPTLRWQNDLAHRPIIYYLRTQEISSSVVRSIGDISASIRLATPEEHVGEEISSSNLTGTVLYTPEILDKQFLERLSLED